jgi:hypothetical protein
MWDALSDEATALWLVLASAAIPGSKYRGIHDRILLRQNRDFFKLDHHMPVLRIHCRWQISIGPLSASDSLFWLHYSAFQVSCYNIYLQIRPSTGNGNMNRKLAIVKHGHGCNAHAKLFAWLKDKCALFESFSHLGNGSILFTTFTEDWWGFVRMCCTAATIHIYLSRN